MGLDLDRCRALGVCTVSLRILGDVARPLVLVAWPTQPSCALRTGPQRLVRCASTWPAAAPPPRVCALTVKVPVSVIVLTL